MKITATDVKTINDTKAASFKGLNHEYNNRLQDVYNFYAPPYDKSKYSLLIELCMVKPDGKGGFEVDKSRIEPFTYNKSYKGLRDSGKVDYPRTIISDPLTSKYMGYRFKLVDKLEANEASKHVQKGSIATPYDKLEAKQYIFDPGSRAKDPETGGEYTVITNTMGMTPKSGPSLHVFYDAFDSAPSVDRNEFKRTHFNKAGGDLDSLLKYPKETSPYRYIMTNPYMGFDDKSSHKYWGKEFYKMPSVEKFKKVNVELFKQGKGYVADGAFTSMGLNSPYAQHVFKHGENSPYYHWFKFNGRPRVGVLPDMLFFDGPGHDEAMEHIGFKIVNPKGTKEYNVDKPSYIQFFDDRLASEEQQNDTKNLIETYDNANTDDPYEITTHQDSVIPYAFELDYSDAKVVKKFSGYTKKMLSDAEIKDNIESFFSFENFDIVRKGHAGGANFWDGSVDIIKLNLSNPSCGDRDDREGSEQIKEHLWGVATHWTKLVDDALLEYLAEAFSENKTEEIAQVAKANDVSAEDLDAIMKMASEDVVNENASSESAKSKIDEIVQDFRYETLPSSPNVAAAFGSPEFQNAMKEPEVRNKLVLSTLNVLSELNKHTKESIFENSSEVNDILKTGTGRKIDNIKLTPFGEYALRLAAPKIISMIVLKAAFPGETIEFDPKSNLVKTNKSLENKSIYELGVARNQDPKKEFIKFAKIISRRINPENSGSQKNIAKQIAQAPIADYTLKNMKMAEALLKKSGGGLNWRFDAAKDVADLTSVSDGLMEFEGAWDDAIKFWSKFVKNVRAVNPASYIVAEVTNLWDFYTNPMYEKYAVDALKRLGVKNPAKNEIDNKISELRGIDWGKYAGDNSPGSSNAGPNVAERAMYEQTDATTSSNYGTWFNQFPNLFGQNFEHGNIDKYANINSIRENLEGYLTTGPLLYLTHSHVFANNHDKPHAAHCMAIDMGAFLSNYGIGRRGSKTTNEDIQRAKEATDRVLGKKPENYKEYSSRAMVVADMLNRSFEKAFEDKPQMLEIVKQAVKDVALGKFKYKTDQDFVRANSFGNEPFDISIRNIMQQAKYIANCDGKPWLTNAESKEIENAAFEEAMKPALLKLANMSDLLNMITGIPFTYAGEYFAHSGYEEATKNVDVTNRNLVRHEWIDKNSPEYKPEIKAYFDRVQAGASLYKQYGMSALAGGMPVSLPQTGKENDLYAIFKYDNKGSNVISVYSSVGLNKDNFLDSMDKNARAEVDSISVKDPQGHEIPVGADDDGNAGFLNRKVYDEKQKKYVDETDPQGRIVKYVVKEGKLRRADGKKIVLNSTVTNFYKPLGISKVSHEEIMSKYSLA